ncbi:MAG: NAD-dependent epimerase/dehydratase family protein [Proteobacteria bacterium]|nr:NAD-dependent epimerase/dehydratase family protein [Pseudomonadota bacterium]
MKNKNNLILGTGPLGLWVAQLLLQQGKNVTVVNTTGTFPYENKPSEIKVIAADITNAKEVKNLSDNVDCVFHCAMPAYTKWAKQFPKMTKGIIEALQNTGIKLIYADNLYMYGDTDGLPVTEDYSNKATQVKGKVRSKIAQDLLKSDIDVVIARASDFYGPLVRNAMLGEDFFNDVSANRAVNLLGNIDLPHTFTYIKDFAKALINLSEHPDCFGQVWHVPNAPTITTRQMINIIEDITGRPIKVRTAGLKMLSILGIFNPVLREMKEMMYQWEKPYLVSHEKYTKRFGENFTTHETAILETLYWFNSEQQHQVFES